MDVTSLRAALVGTAALLAPAIPVPAAALPLFINELHYDNAGGDRDEGVELAGVAGSDLTGWRIELYNGGSGTVYGGKLLSGEIPGLADGWAG